MREHYIRLYNEELCHLYPSPDIFRMIKSRLMRWTGHTACVGKRKGAYRDLVGARDGKRPLGRLRRRWENINMDLQEVGGGHGLIWLRIGRGGGRF
jgi:hypothetical protein